MQAQVFLWIHEYSPAVDCAPFPSWSQEPDTVPTLGGLTELREATAPKQRTAATCSLSKTDLGAGGRLPH